MNTNIWGPSAWRLIHSMAFTYPREPNLIDKQRYKSLFESLSYTLPCVNCQYNYQKELLHFDLDIALRSREHLSRWAFNLHNSVNKRLNKKEMSYEEVRELYTDLINSIDKEKNKEKIKKNIIPKIPKISIIHKKILGIIGLISFGIILYKHRK